MAAIRVVPSACEMAGERPGDQIGHYKLLQVIGEGGMGTVWMAEQEQPLRRKVALKVVKLGMDTRQVVARFEAERQALALMDHPNIAKVLDAGATDRGRPFFVMELVRGVRITDYCDQHNLPPEERLKLFIKVCQAVQHAHQKGVIHRDIKPSNVLVTLQEDGTATPKIIDFGISKATAGQSLTDKTLFTAFEQFVGTPAYMSPEQAEMASVDIDTRSDIYSLGVLLYELLTGTTPFEVRGLRAPGLEAIRRVICEQEPLRPSTRLKALPGEEATTAARHRRCEPPKLVDLIQGDLDCIVMKCLEKDRTRRYETANGLAVEIGRHLANEPVSACPPSQLYRLRKLVWRNKLAVAAASGIALTLILGAGLSLWQASRAKRAEAFAKLQSQIAIQQKEATLAAQRRTDEIVRHIIFNGAGSSLQGGKFQLNGLTFNLTFDSFVQGVLGGAIRRARGEFRASSALGVVVDPVTGDLLAFANDPPVKEEDLNPCVSYCVEPGMLMRFIIAAAAMNEGKASSTEAIDCEHGHFEVGGTVIHDFEPYGMMCVNAILTHASDIGTAKLALRLGDKGLHDYLHRFGLGERAGIHLAGEAAGEVLPAEDWSAARMAEFSRGHGITATPLQLVMAMSGLANGGKLMSPRLVKSITGEGGQVLVNYPSEAVRTVVSAEVAGRMRSALTRIVWREGGAPAAAVPGYATAGVSATVESNERLGVRTHASFVGFAPVEKPLFVCLIYVEEPKSAHYAGTVATRAFSQVSSRILPYLERRSGASHQANGVRVPGAALREASLALHPTAGAGHGALTQQLGTIKQGTHHD